MTLAMVVGLTIVGLCIGSFLTTLASRVDTHFAGVLTGRSRCPKCGSRLDARDLVPLFSWLLLRGRCRRCGAPIGAGYPLTEIAAATIGLVAAALMPPKAAGVAAVLGWWLLALALIDLRSLRLPDTLTLPLIPAGLVVAWIAAPLDLLMPTPPVAALGAMLGFIALVAVRAAYQNWRGREGLGLGDAKLCGAAGAWLGPQALPWLVLVAAGLGLIGALLVHRRLRADLAIPFGPPLALAYWLLFVAVQTG